MLANAIVKMAITTVAIAVIASPLALAAKPSQSKKVLFWTTAFEASLLEFC
jgi:hypothetical protein